jgi:hypothetical protein
MQRRKEAVVGDSAMNAFQEWIAERGNRGSAEEQKRGTQGLFPEPL